MSNELGAQAYAKALMKSISDTTPGWQLVPIEPTAEMAEAGRDCPVAFAASGEFDALEDYIGVYKAMLNAAPEYKGAK